MTVLIAPDHNWIADPLADALIASIEARHAVAHYGKVPSFSALYERADIVFYDDGRVDKLGLIRGEYGDRCLDWSNADYPANKQPFVDFCALPNEQVLTAIICGDRYYDPTDQWTAFAAAWREGRRIAA